MEEHHSQGSEENRVGPNGAVRTEAGDRFRRNQGTILFVGNLPFSTPWQHVKDHFREAGKVRYTDLIADRNGRPKGSALVTMMTPEDADNAIMMFNETDFEGRRLIVRKFDDGPRPPLVQRDMMPPYGTASSHANMNANRSPYGSGGVVTNGAGNTVVGFRSNFPGGVPPNGANAGPGLQRPYGRGGYIPRPYDMDGDLNQQLVPDLGGDLPKPRSQQVPEMGRRLLVSNLPYDCNNTALRETFQQVGMVDRAEVLLAHHGQSRGVGIVVMRTEEDARVAIAEFDGIEMANRAMSVRLDKKP